MTSTQLKPIQSRFERWMYYSVSVEIKANN